MNKKVIDYIIVELTNDSAYASLYPPAGKGTGLAIAILMKTIEDEILILENKKKLLHQVIKYKDELLNKKHDYANIKVTEEEVLFYKEKYNDSHPLKNNQSLDEEEFRTELKNEVQNQKNEIVEIEKKIVKEKKQIHHLQISKRALEENNENLDFETFRTHFEKYVLYYLEKGYVPQGAVSVTKLRGGILLYSQAMVKYEE
jgi:hypothetical protein